jgi:hypothetical protein
MDVVLRKKGEAMRNKMKCIVAVALMANAVMAQQAQLKGPIKVFILAGQSNMEGQGVVSMDGERDYNGGKIVTIRNVSCNT